MIRVRVVRPNRSMRFDIDPGAVFPDYEFVQRPGKSQSPHGKKPHIVAKDLHDFARKITRSVRAA